MMHLQLPPPSPSTTSSSSCCTSPTSPTTPTIPPPTTGPTPSALLPKFPIKRALSHILILILGNTIILLLIIISLYATARKESIDQWGKRAFNFAVILLSAILSWGIGNLLDQLGLLARGGVLAANAHTEISIRYIIRGSMTAVGKLLMHHILRRPRTCNRTTLLAALYLVFSVSARLSVAVLGLTFNVDESVHGGEKLAVSRWPLPGEVFTDVAGNVHRMTLDTLYQHATLGVRMKTTDTGAKHTNLTSDAPRQVRETISQTFTARELLQRLVPGQSVVSYDYQLREFRGNVTVPSNRTVSVSTECTAYVTGNSSETKGEFSVHGIREDDDITFTSGIFDINQYPLDGFAAERIFIPPNGTVASASSSCGPLCVRLWLWDKFLNTPGEATYRCENRISLPRGEEVTSMLGSQAAALTTISSSLAESLLRFLGASEATTDTTTTTTAQGFHYRDVTDLEGFTDFANAIGLDSSYPNGEIWVAAVLGRLTAVLILYLDETLPKAVLSETWPTARSKLSVRWSRVGGLLGVMVGVQVALALGTVCYARGAVLIPDEVSPLGELVGSAGALAIPRSSTMSGIGAGRGGGRRGRRDRGEYVRARFCMRNEGGTRRWILVFEGEGEDGGDRDTPGAEMSEAAAAGKSGKSLGYKERRV